MSDALARLFHGAEPCRLAADTPLFRTGDPVRRLYRIADGAVALTRVTAAGARIMLQRAASGEVLAEASVYSTSYHCEARCLSPALVHAIPVARFRARLASNPALAEAWATQLAQSVQTARLRAEIRTLRTVAERLDAWMDDGRALPTKGAWQDLAAELGVSREALYRELAKRRGK